MNTVATVERPRSKLDAFVGEVLPPEKQRLVAQALPRHVTYPKFEAEFRDALMANPDLLKCDPREIYVQVHNAASIGLRFNPVLGEVYLIAGFSNKDRRHKPQLRLGFRGLTKLARQSGEISVVNAYEVCAGDLFRYRLEDGELRVLFEPDVFGDRGDIRGYLASARFSTGEVDYEFMTIAEIEDVRDRYSDGWKAFKAGKIRSTPWSDSPGEMAKKTVIRRMLKRLPMSSELAEAIKLDDNAQAPEEQLTPSRGRPRLAAALERAAAGPRPPEPTPPTPPQPIPPQPEDDEEPPEPWEDDDQDMALAAEMALEAAEQLDEPMPKSEMYDEERTKLYAAGMAAANQGARKFRFWRAKQMPEELAKLTPEDLKQLETIGKEADKQAPAADA